VLGLRVLLVDVSDRDLATWSNEFAVRSHDVLRASDRRCALRAAVAQQPELIVVELFLGRESGLDVVADARARHPDSFIVVASRYMNVAYAMAAISAGANHAFVKPVRAAEIERCYRLRGHALRFDEDTTTSSASLEQIEWEHIARVLLDCKGNISHAADRLGMYRQSLQRKLRRHAPIGATFAAEEE
jgi:two-component system response regulator RegA